MNENKNCMCAILLIFPKEMFKDKCYPQGDWRTGGKTRAMLDKIPGVSFFLLSFIFYLELVFLFYLLSGVGFILLLAFCVSLV